MKELFELKKTHEIKKREIDERLCDFKKLAKATEKKIFEELCFCLLTPGAKAENCKKIVKKLKKDGLLFSGNRKELWPYLKFARFYDQKASRLIAARETFKGKNGIAIKKKVFCGDPKTVRLWLVNNVKGLGYKEASHFLRNIGKGEELAILDRHILKRLKNYRVIKEVPVSLTARRYLEIEAEMKKFSGKLGIPLSHLDLLFFSRATGKPVKFCK
ncbi:MAG TPA: N-glycosylase/DNA lyase [Candidatus Omnitrophota bacterium]|nr:N-glycosylase/DNA lyase [Candidatus Omnitrophota bacterium]